MKRPKIMGLNRLLLALALTLLLGACAAPGFRAEVTRFHEIDVPQRKIVLMQPMLVVTEVQVADDVGGEYPLIADIVNRQDRAGRSKQFVPRINRA